MEEITFNKNVVYELDDLVILLVKENYFSYLETAEDYVNKIYDFIYNEIPNNRHRKTPKELTQHGPYYVKYSAGKRTAWYVFFDKKDKRYLIEYITNNHVAKATFLNALNKN